MTIDEIIRRSLEEDIHYGDISSENLMLGNKEITAYAIAKESGVISGMDIFRKVFIAVDQNTKVKIIISNGKSVEKGNKIAEIKGNAVSVLKAERVALNFIQRLSGIASMTARYVDAIGDNKAKLLDTRKTTPLLRQLEKQAVRDGGGFNHRFGLYDMIMLKENHIRSAGSISKAVEIVKKNDVSHKLEVEVTCLQELKEAYNSGADRVMLDNMSIEDMQKAVAQFHGKVELEASGNVTESTIGRIAQTGVDYISSGSLTHSYKSLDISLLFEEINK